MADLLSSSVHATSTHRLIVIAGLDPAIQENSTNPDFFARQLDCRVKPGNDSSVNRVLVPGLD
jgi:hypothetical protein